MYTEISVANWIWERLRGDSVVNSHVCNIICIIVYSSCRFTIGNAKLGLYVGSH